MDFKELQNRLDKELADESEAFNEKQRAEWQAFHQRQLERRLKFLKDNPEGVLESALKQAELDHKIKHG